MDGLSVSRNPNQTLPFVEKLAGMKSADWASFGARPARA